MGDNAWLRQHLLLHDLVWVLNLNHARFVLFAHPARQQHRAEHAVSVAVADRFLRLFHLLCRALRVGVQVCRRGDTALSEVVPDFDLGRVVFFCF